MSAPRDRDAELDALAHGVRDEEAEALALARIGETSISRRSLGDLLRELVCGPLDDEADFAGNVLRALADDLEALRRGDAAEVLVSVEYLHRLETRARVGAELARRLAEAEGTKGGAS